MKKKSKQRNWSIARNEHEMNVEYALTIKRLHQAPMPAFIGGGGGGVTVALAL